MVTLNFTYYVDWSIILYYVTGADTHTLKWRVLTGVPQKEGVLEYCLSILHIKMTSVPIKRRGYQPLAPSPWSSHCVLYLYHNVLTSRDRNDNFCSIGDYFLARPALLVRSSYKYVNWLELSHKS